MLVLLKWIIPVLSRIWLPVAGVFGVFLIYVKGKKDQKKDNKIEELQEDLETVKRIQNVKVNTDRNAALDRLSDGGHVRKD